MITREQILQEIKRDGIEAVKARSLHKKAKDRPEYDKVIQEVESSDVLARQEAREEESLSISRKALAISEEANSIASKARSEARFANRIATSAIILSISMAILEIIKWSSTKN